jgi:inhibitor of cysteine peptidase
MTFVRLSYLRSTLVCTALILLLSACAPSTPGSSKGSELEPTATPGQPAEPQDQPGGKRAHVQAVELVILESFPVQVHALVKGNLADGCTEIDRIEQQRDLEIKTFTITITTSRDPNLMCTQALVPFEETVPLDVRDLPAGTYSVNVNGVQGSFELQMDNSLS